MLFSNTLLYPPRDHFEILNEIPFECNSLGSINDPTTTNTNGMMINNTNNPSRKYPPPKTNLSFHDILKNFVFITLPPTDLRPR